MSPGWIINPHLEHVQAVITVHHLKPSSDLPLFDRSSQMCMSNFNFDLDADRKSDKTSFINLKSPALFSTCTANLKKKVTLWCMLTNYRARIQNVGLVP